MGRRKTQSRYILFGTTFSLTRPRIEHNLHLLLSVSCQDIDAIFAIDAGGAWSTNKTALSNPISKCEPSICLESCDGEKRPSTSCRPRLEVRKDADRHFSMSVNAQATKASHFRIKLVALMRFVNSIVLSKLLNR
jgi:hypothetical protein